MTDSKDFLDLLKQDNERLRDENNKLVKRVEELSQKVGYLEADYRERTKQLKNKTKHDRRKFCKIMRGIEKNLTRMRASVEVLHMGVNTSLVPEKKEEVLINVSGLLQFLVTLSSLINETKDITVLRFTKEGLFTLMELNKNYGENK